MDCSSGSSFTYVISSQPGQESILMIKTVVSGGIHTITTYLNPIPSMVPFQGANAPQPTVLQAHIYGIKNVYTILIRLYAAYSLHQNRELYFLAMWSFAGVLFLYTTEVFIWHTVRMREASIALITAGIGLGWMWTQMDYYLPSP